MQREEDIYLQGHTHKELHVYKDDFIPSWFLWVLHDNKVVLKLIYQNY